MKGNIYDLVVVGGGITGCEASWTAASRGMKTLLCNITLDQVNLPPHISALFIPEKVLERDLAGLGGGIFLQALRRSILGIFREPDDSTAIISLDRREFSLVSKELLENHPMLDLNQALISSMRIGENIELSSIFGETFTAKKALFAPGTYVGGRIRVGKSVIPAGRYGDLPSEGLKEVFEEQGLRLVKWEGRTPKVVDMRRINLEEWQELPAASGDTINIVLGGKELAQAGAKAYFREEQGKRYYLLPLSHKTREAHLCGGEGSQATHGLANKEAVVRDSVEHSCLVMGSGPRTWASGLAFAGKFTGKNGYMDCALDGRDQALRLMEEE